MFLFAFVNNCQN